MESDAWLTATAGFAILALAGAPLIAPWIARRLGRVAPAAQWTAFAVAAAFPALVLAGLATSLRAADWAANVLLVVLAYLATGVLLMSCFRLRPRLLGRTLGVMGCVLLVMGALAGTLGCLGVGWFVAGQQPVHLQAMPDGTVCRVTLLGDAVSPKSDRGYSVSIRQPLPLLSWVEHVQSTRHLPLYALQRDMVGHPEMLCAVPPKPSPAAPSA